MIEPSTLSLRDVSVSLRGRALLNGISLCLEPGSFTAIVGPNGAGKSLLLKTALGLVVPQSGSVDLDGRSLARMRSIERAAHLAWLPQRVLVHEPIAALDVVAAARYRFQENRNAALKAGLACLKRVRADHLADRMTTNLSGGEQQRVAMAALLAQEAPIIMLDEPASSLDPAWQIETYQMLGVLWRSGFSVVCVTHDVNALGDAGDDMAVVGIGHGRVRFSCAYRDPALADHLGELFSISMTAHQIQDRRMIIAHPKSEATVP